MNKQERIDVENAINHYESSSNFWRRIAIGATIIYFIVSFFIIHLLLKVKAQVLSVCLG